MRDGHRSRLLDGDVSVVVAANAGGGRRGLDRPGRVGDVRIGGHGARVVMRREDRGPRSRRRVHRAGSGGRDDAAEREGRRAIHSDARILRGGALREPPGRGRPHGQGLAVGGRVVGARVVGARVVRARVERRSIARVVAVGRARVVRVGVVRAGVVRAGVVRAGVVRAGVVRAGVVRAGVIRVGVVRARVVGAVVAG